ncbi:MAG: arylsulfatase [Verrucomicrobiota bacterium]
MKSARPSLLRSLWLLGLAASLATTAAAKKPNVIVMLSDDQGWGDFSLHGNTQLDTPNLDQLARSGAQFDRFYVCAVCAPTRAEFLTGRYYAKTGVYGVSRGAERLNEDETLVSEIFQRAGYQTAVFGKWHNGSQYPYHPNARGFHEFYGFGSGHWAHYFSPILDHNGDIVRGQGYLTDDLTERAMDYIEQHQEKPFFVYLALNTPHSPMQVPDRWWNKYQDMPSTQEFFEKNRENLDHTRAAYAMCENIDWNVGRLLDKLDQLGLAEDTIVLYFNDNGPNGRRWNGGMLGRKGSIDEGGVRSPLFVRWQGKIRPGTLVEPIASSIDLLPTLAELAEIDYSGTKPLDGLSLKPLLAGQTADWPERALYQFRNNKVSVRTQRYRLNGDGKLFDMVADPAQQNPVNEEFPEMAETLQAKAAAWLKEHQGLGHNKGSDDRPFIIGHPDAKMSQIPARDGRNRGGITRPSKHPNASYFTTWTSTKDSIVWDCEVGKSGRYLVELFYTCPAADVGSTIQLSFNDSQLIGKITEAHDPPLQGVQEDRVKRKEAYSKEWNRMSLGVIELRKGQGSLKLEATDIPGSQVMDLRTVLLTRLD